MNDSIDRLQAIQDKWRKEYDKTIPDKLLYLESLINEMKKNFQEDTLKSYRMEIHKIAGSAGTVGYHNVSVICKALDQELSSLLETFKENPPDSEWLKKQTDILNHIRQSFSSTRKTP